MEAMMPDLKLPKNPDRTPVKMTIQLLPDLADACSNMPRRMNRPMARPNRSPS